MSFDGEAVTRDNNPKKKGKRAKIAPLLEGRIDRAISSGWRVVGRVWGTREREDWVVKAASDAPSFIPSQQAQSFDQRNPRSVLYAVAR